MRRPCCVILISLTCLVGVSPGVRAQGLDLKELEALSEQPLLGRLSTESLPSKALGRKARFVVYEPPAIDGATTPSRRPSLTLFLHGVFENESRWLRRGAPQRIEAEILAGRIGPTVVVAPEGRLSFWVDAAEPGHAWRRFLLEELLPHVETRYRTRSGPEGRRLLGVSMGGYAALGIALTAPERFGAVATAWPLVPALDPATLDPEVSRLFAHWSMKRAVARIWGTPLDPEAWRRSHPLALAKASDRSTLPPLEILTSAGTWPGHQGTAALISKVEAFEPAPRVLTVEGAPGWELLSEHLGALLRFLDQAATPVPAGDASESGGDGR